MYPRIGFKINMTVHAGDTMSAEVQYVGNNNFALILSNTTTGQTFTTTKKAKASRQSAEWIVEAPFSGGALPLADFGTIPFSSASATLNGHTGSISDTAWQDDPITMVDSSGASLAVPSSLSAGGSGFSVSYVGGSQTPNKHHGK